MNDAMVFGGFQTGRNEFSPTTFDCTDYQGCLYCVNGRCCYNIANIKSQVSRACYEELCQDEVECYLDSLN